MEIREDLRITIYLIENLQCQNLDQKCYVIGLICTIYCITDMVCTAACQRIEVERFLGSFHLCLFLTYVNQTTKSNLSKNYYQILGTGFS